jgi:hypothetical protein
MDDVIAAALTARASAVAASRGTAGLTYLVTSPSIMAQRTQGDNERANDRTIHAQDVMDDGCSEHRRYLPDAARHCRCLFGSVAVDTDTVITGRRC